MKTQFTLFNTILCLFFISCNNNIKNKSELATEKNKSDEFRSPASFFDKKKAHILVVGTFHFDYPNLDAHKTDKKDRVDVLSPQRQKEMTELVDYIKTFKPNKVAIEATENWKATEKLRKYNTTNIKQQRDERFQLAIRIAHEMDLDTVFAIDASNMYMDFQKTNPNIINSLESSADSIVMDSALLEQYKSWRSYSNEIVKNTSLLNYFHYINSKEYHQYDYGNYLIDFFKLDNQRGADILSIWWYNRNLRIFSKIQSLTKSNNDRILVLIGNGHAAVLRQLLQSSVEYEYIEFKSL